MDFSPAFGSFSPPPNRAQQGFIFSSPDRGLSSLTTRNVSNKMSQGILSDGFSLPSTFMRLQDDEVTEFVNVLAASHLGWHLCKKNFNIFLFFLSRLFSVHAPCQGSLSRLVPALLLCNSERRRDDDTSAHGARDRGNREAFEEAGFPVASFSASQM